jgi:hypothetical protein
MAKKRIQESPELLTSNARQKRGVKAVRLELPEEDYQRLSKRARSLGLPMAAYARMAVMERIAADEGKLKS